MLKLSEQKITLGGTTWGFINTNSGCLVKLENSSYLTFVPGEWFSNGNLISSNPNSPNSSGGSKESIITKNPPSWLESIDDLTIFPSAKVNKYRPGYARHGYFAQLLKKGSMKVSEFRQLKPQRKRSPLWDLRHVFAKDKSIIIKDTNGKDVTKSFIDFHKNDSQGQNKISGRDFRGRKIKLKRSRNPRKLDTHGWRSWEIVSSHGGEMLYDDYLGAGGRLRDLKHDITKGWAVVE